MSSRGVSLADRLAELAGTLQQEDDVEGTLDAVVQAAVATVPRAEHAGISSVRRRRVVTTLAATGDLPRQVDQAQYDTEQGPCLETLYERATVRLPDLAQERRWPAFTARVHELGVSSMLAVQLFVEGEDLGALNLSSPSSHAFDEESEHVALLFASHAAVAMTGAQREQRMTSALGTHDLVGQAKGVLVERHKVTSEQAFLLLVRASQEANRRLQDVAEELVRTGRLPTT